MKTKILASLLLALFVSACTRNASEGVVVIQVLDFVDHQPLGLHASSARSALAPMAESSTSTTGANPTVCLVDSTTPPSELGRLDPTWECAAADVDGTATFSREEGTKIALTDVNGDGFTDSITYDVAPGSRQTLTVTTINHREDGGYLISENDKVIYSPGDTIIVHVFGWLPSAETVHVELWNNWNSGFHYWSSEPRVLSGAIDFEVQMEIPIHWPTTNTATGAAYFSYPVANDLVYNGDNFVLLWSGQGKPPEEGPAPTNPKIVLNDGALAVSSTTVTATLSAKDATFYRMSNDPEEILTVPWQPLAVSEGTDVPWTLAPGADGNRDVYVQYSNTYGAMTGVVSDGIILDATPIQILNLQATPTLGRQATSFTISFTLSEAATGGLAVSFAGAPVTITCAGLACSGAYVALGTEPEGAAIVGVTAIDWVGWKDRESISATLDFTPPDTLFSGVVPNGILGTTAANFGLASDDVNVTYECSLGLAPFTSCTSAVSLTNLPDGEHTFRARATDLAGNVDATPASTTWTVDTTGPDTQIDSSPTGTVNVVLATFTFSSPSLDLDHFECRIDNGIFANCASGLGINGLNDGLHSFDVRGVDQLGNVDPSPASVAWNLDTLAPDTLIASAPTGTVAVTSATLVFYSLASDIAGFECSQDGASFTACLNPGTLSGLSDGVHTFAIRAFDTAGNTDASPVVAQWTVDMTPPDTQITLAPSGSTTATTATISFTSAAVDLAGFECSLDGALYASCTSSVLLSGLSEVTHTYQVRAVDQVGNKDASPASVTWTVDHTAPDTRIDSAPAAFTSSSDAAIAFSSPSPDVVAYQCRRDTEAFAPCTSSMLYTGLGDGSHTFSVRAIDGAGNIDPTPASTAWNIDLTPPDTTIVGGPTGQVKTSTNAFTLTADEPATFECSLNGAAFAACPAALVYSAQADDDYTLEARAIDQAGAMDPTPATRSWTVDTTPPDTTITQAPASVTNVANATLAFSADEAATFQCMLDGNGGLGFTACTNPALYAGLAEGLHTFQVRAIDTAGNVDDSPALAAWTIDTRAPLIFNLVATSGPLTTGGTVTISFDISESAVLTVTVGGTAGVLLSNTGLHYEYTFPVAGTEADGTNAVLVTALDAAGNLGSAGTSVLFDFSPPDTITGPTLPPALSNQVLVFADFSSTEANSTFECALNSVIYAPCAPLFVSGTLTDGVYTLLVRAIDAVGLVDPTPGEITWEVDLGIPADPAAGLMTVTVQPAGTEDELTGAAGAVEPYSIVHVYADAALFIEVGTTIALGDGSFVTFPIGDDSGDALEQIYVTSEDAAGNESGATPLLNPRLPPRLTSSLITIYVSLDASGNFIGNPGDELEVTWDNSLSGDANANITSATFTIPGMGLGPIVMTDSGGGIYRGSVALVEAPHDGLFAAEVSVFNTVGLGAGPVLSDTEANVDVEIPLAVPTLIGGMNGMNLGVTWTASTSIDVVRYFVFYGETAGDVSVPLDTGFVDAPTLTLTGLVPVCSDQYYAVRVIDDAGNLSPLVTAGPQHIEVQPPSLVAWGNIAGLKVKLLNLNGADAAELHFSLVTETSTPPPWNLASPLYADSPVTLGTNISLVSPLQAGSQYWLSARGKRDTCTGEFGEPVSASTLGVLGHQGGIGICPGCCIGPECTLPGRWYFGGLGFAVAGVGDAYGSDGKEDILTAVPGQSLAILVSGQPMAEVGYIYGYYASLDVIGGGPMLASAGDINSDGKEEYIIGSPLAPTTTTGMKGMVRIIDGATKATLVTQMGTANGMQLGYSVSVIGDIDGDTIPDIIAGGVGCANFSCSDTTATEGTALVISGSGSGILRTHEGPVGSSFFGVSVHGGVDLNGDGKKDYVVGAPGKIGTNPPLGRAQVFSGADGSILHDFQGTADEKFGFSVRLARSGINAYVIVGAPSRVGVPGKVYVYDANGNLFKTLLGDIPEASENFGAAIVSGGDIDGDGMMEIVVGDPNIPLSSQYGNGAAFLYKLTTSDYTGGLAYEISGGELDGALGYGLDYISDVNGDGIDELVVGAPGAAVDGIYNAGRIYLLTVNP